MVSTRSAIRVNTAVRETTPVGLLTPAPTPRTPRKRKLAVEEPVTPTKPVKRKRASAAAVPPTPVTPSTVTVAAEITSAPIAVKEFIEEEDILPPVLSFDLEHAKRHIIAADERFHEVFNRLPCKPFEVLDVVHPFRTLATSILGQQISWRAARSITAKFLRIFDPSLPERGDVLPHMADRPFPTPHQLASTSIPTLRGAGLSQRKAEYVIDLASRFADGRLSASLLSKATDEELAESLIAVRGIGPWTVDMFAMFSAHRPDIMPYGDLGVQRGLLRWVLASHDSNYRIEVEPKKLPQPSVEEEPEAAEAIEPAPKEEDGSAVPPIPTPETPKKRKKAVKVEVSRDGVHIPTGTPIKLPTGLTVAQLKSRLAGKKEKKGVYLTPEEMDALTEGWKPYRSIAVWYMWALAEESL
ncbi:DNA glycosylase [Calocera viscosa TUFC12733]|uniref:DNA glycosylase n=1 Tax=Calocera viscosa (strain TUFC12733) TaxID=1330018 RepID=A0A167GNW9_CALVF|nr:DNA glycosylase [Calocera viscosa TUFC12733]